MKKIENLIADKLIDVIHYGLSKIIKADFSLNNVKEISEEMIIKLKEEEQIEAIILDVDETIRKEMKNIPECNKQWIEMVGKYLKITVLTNGKDKKIQDYFNEKGIDYISFAHKPLKRNFLKACENMNVDPKKVMVVGDGILDDIYGGKKNNMKTVLIKDVEDDER